MIVPEQTIDLLYEAALLPDRWKAILDHITGLVGALGTTMISSHDARTVAMATERVRHVAEDLSKPEWAGVNVRGQLLLTLPQAEFHSDADYYSDAEMEKMPLYRDFAWPRGIGYAAATWISVPNGDNLIFSIERPRKDGPFPRETVQLLTALRPHLARSAMLAARMDFQRIQTANSVFEVTGLPSAAIRADGKVIDCNRLFVERPSQVLVGANDKLKLASAPADEKLRQCLSRSSILTDHSRLSSRSLPLPATEFATAAVVHLIPVKRVARDLISTAAFFLVITPISGQSSPGVDIIQGLFDLTTAEARIARSIATGLDVTETAAEIGISRETVRYHLKQIFRKTGFSRQSDLASAVSRIRPIG